MLREEAIQGVDQLKTALTTAPERVYSDFYKPFLVQCDASQFGVKAVLFQKDAKNQNRPISFYSAKLNKHQRDYSITEKM